MCSPGHFNIFFETGIFPDSSPRWNSQMLPKQTFLLIFVVLFLRSKNGVFDCVFLERGDFCMFCTPFLVKNCPPCFWRHRLRTHWGQWWWFVVAVVAVCVRFTFFFGIGENNLPRPESEKKRRGLPYRRSRIRRTPSVVQRVSRAGQKFFQMVAEQKVGTFNLSACCGDRE